MLWKIEQVKEGVRVTFDPGLLFGPDSASLTAKAEDSIRDLVRMLAWCRDMDILVEAWTQSTGSTEIHRNITWKRMAVVAAFARGLGLKASPSVPPIAGTTPERMDHRTARPGSQLQRE